METITVAPPSVPVDLITTWRAWWPAHAVLPDKSVLHRVRAYATTAGLIIYRRVPVASDGPWGALEPDWYSPITPDAAPPPRLGQLPGQSWDVTTEAGLVVITYVGGCGCGTALKRWRPAFSTCVAPWPTAGPVSA